MACRTRGGSSVAPAAPRLPGAPRQTGETIAQAGGRSKRNYGKARQFFKMQRLGTPDSVQAGLPEHRAHRERVQAPERFERIRERLASMREQPADESLKLGCVDDRLERRPDRSRTNADWTFGAGLNAPGGSVRSRLVSASRLALMASGP